MSYTVSVCVLCTCVCVCNGEKDRWSVKSKCVFAEFPVLCVPKAKLGFNEKSNHWIKPFAP